MKNQKFLILGLSLTISFNPLLVQAHPGRTDGSGGHSDNKNISGLGHYHYHCGGYSAHLHKTGCPYSQKTPSNNQNLKIQKRLKELGYNPGKADGVFGKKSKEALKNFQKDKGLKIDGIPGKNTLKALKL